MKYNGFLGLGDLRRPEPHRSMETLDATAVSQLAVKLGLVTPSHMEEVKQEVNGLGLDAGPLLRQLERKGYLTPWQSNKLLKGEQDGYFLGGNRVLYKIASGSFGRVFRAENPHTGEMVAIKVLRQRWSEDPHTIELFEREGKLGKSLRHPNIVTILDVNKDPVTRQYYIVMEFVEGGNLRDFLAIRKKLEPAEALRLLEDAAAALTYAYSKGLTHRDVKLTNILISTQQTAKLVDFGLADLFTYGPKDVDSKMDRTVDYAGLEKATGVKSGDVRSDVYFLGCVLYEMLTGRPPLLLTRDRRARMDSKRFDADNIVPMSPEEVAAPPVVFRLVETMMAFSPLERYQTPAQLLEAVREARRQVGDPGRASQPAAPPEPTVFIVEKNQRLRELLRDNLKELGYRVFIAGDPTTALLRFRQQPCDALIMDAGALETDEIFDFDKILSAADKKKHPSAGILILSEKQVEWKDRIPAHPQTAIMVRPVTLKQLAKKLVEFIPIKKETRRDQPGG
jgi:eukaryotic-like serine/threonine-protein kinase